MRGAAAAWLALLLALPAAAAEIEGVVFAERVELAGEPLALHGTGLLRYRWIFKGYVAALYMPPGTPAARALDDVPKRLEIEYFWSSRVLFIVLNVVGGIAVLGSYVWGLESRPDPGAARFTPWFLLRTDERTRFFGRASAR